MSGIGPIGGMTGGAQSRALAPARLIEKASASSRLGAGQQDSRQHRPKQTPRLQVELLCQDETPRFDPLRDAPRVLPTFAAQLMGQVMPQARVTTTVAAAYGKIATRCARLVDRKD